MIISHTYVLQNSILNVLVVEYIKKFIIDLIRFYDMINQIDVDLRESLHFIFYWRNVRVMKGIMKRVNNKNLKITLPHLIFRSFEVSALL